MADFDDTRELTAPYLTPTAQSSQTGLNSSLSSFHYGMDERSVSDTETGIDMSDYPARTSGNEKMDSENTAAGPPASTSTPNDSEAIPEKPHMMHPSQFPDGGFRAWKCVFGSWCALFVTFGWINCIGVFQDYYETHQLHSYTPSTVAWIVSLETFMMFVGGPLFGFLYDNYGTRHLLAAGTFLHVFGLMMASISSQYYQFILAQGICSPIGASMIFYPAVSSVSTWFHRHRALALGITAAGSSVGGVIFPIMVARLVPMVGFGWAMRIAAFLILGLLIVSNVLIEARIPPHKRDFSFKVFLSPLLEIPFLLMTIANFMFFFGMFIPFAYIIPQAEQRGMSARLASYLIPILNTASVFGRTLPGFAGDRFGRFNVMIVMSYFSCITVLALWLPAHSNAAIIVFCILYGFGSGAFIGMGPALVAQISDVRQIGSRTGTLFFVISFAALTGNPIGGALIQIDQERFVYCQVFAGVAMFVGSSFFVWSRVVQKGWSPLVKV